MYWEKKNLGTVSKISHKFCYNAFPMLTVYVLPFPFDYFAHVDFTVLIDKSVKLSDYSKGQIKDVN